MRLREVLNLRWDQVDLEQGLIVLSKHKTSRKTGAKGIVLNAPALQVLTGLPRVGVYVIAGDTAGQKGEKPRPTSSVRGHSSAAKPGSRTSEFTTCATTSEVRRRRRLRTADHRQAARPQPTCDNGALRPLRQ